MDATKPSPLIHGKPVIPIKLIYTEKRQGFATTKNTKGHPGTE